MERIKALRDMQFWQDWSNVTECGTCEDGLRPGWWILLTPHLMLNSQIVNQPTSSIHSGVFGQRWPSPFDHPALSHTSGLVDIFHSARHEGLDSRVMKNYFHARFSTHLPFTSVTCVPKTDGKKLHRMKQFLEVKYSIVSGIDVDLRSNPSGSSLLKSRHFTLEPHVEICWGRRGGGVSSRECCATPQRCELMYDPV